MNSELFRTKTGFLQRETGGEIHRPYYMFVLMFLIVSGFPGAVSNAHSAEHLTTQLNNTFEGELTLSRYVITPDGDEEQVSRTPMLIHTDFILVKQSDAGGFDLIGNIKAESILVRQRREDFVFFTADQQAVIMNKQELQQMILMLESMRGTNSNQADNTRDVALEETAEQKTIQGFPSRKWIIKVENSEAEWHVWVTEEMSIEWGMLSESWLTRHTIFKELPTTDWLGDNRLPVQAELWNNGRVTEILRFEDISPETLNETQFRIPPGYQRLTFQQMLFNRMRNR